MSEINREETIRLLMAYPGPIDKKIVRKILETMPAVNAAELPPNCLAFSNKLTDEDCARIAEMIAKEPLRILPNGPDRKKGHWLRPQGAARSSYRFQCSECGHICYQVTGNCGRKAKVESPDCTYRYCPWCGASMGGEP